METGKKATIRDVARLAGVSIATVSRFLNNSGYVEKETAGKIRRAVETLDFKPSRMAQGLKTSKSRQIMLVVPDIGNPFYSVMYKTVQSAAHEKGYSVILYNTNEDSSEEMTAVEMFYSIKADGIIFCSVNINTSVMQELEKSDLPVVVLNSYEKPVFDTVRSIKGMGIHMAARHLIELGHRNIAYAGGSGNSVVNENRKSGYLKALEEAGIASREDYIFEMGFTMDAGYKAGRYFTTLQPLPTAICAANDLIAMGIMLAFNECGIRIPDDISLTGMDNIEFAALSRPGLTTVTNDPVEFGRNAAAFLFDRIEGLYKGEPREVNIPRRLIIRSSTSECRAT